MGAFCLRAFPSQFGVSQGLKTSMKPGDRNQSIRKLSARKTSWATKNDDVMLQKSPSASSDVHG